MAKKISNKINSQFMPTYINGVPIFMCGGKMKYGLGGRMMFDPGGFIPADRIQGIQPNVVGAETLARMNTTTLDPMTAKVSGGAGLSTGLTQGMSAVGQGMEEITNAYRPNKANYGTNIGGGALKGAAMGATLGSIVPGVGTVIGGVVGGVGGAISGLTKSIAKSGEIKQQKEQAQQQQQDMLKQQLISNLPGQSSYVPTFAGGGEIVDRVTSFDTGGLHSENPNGGIKVGQRALTEEGEVMFTTKTGKKYIFSNRF